MLFAADRTCCVCRESGKPIQIHHIDEDPTHHDPANLAVLCLTCHESTQVKGGFSRRLDGDQIRLYRDSWDQTIAASRSTSGVQEQLTDRDAGEYDARLVAALVEINREASNDVNLAFLYHAIGNEELRDKAVDRAIGAGATDELLVMLRRLQGRVAEVPPEVMKAHLTELEKPDRYRTLAVVYEDLGRYREAAEVFIRGLAADLASLEDFTVAHHLQELADTGIIPGLFVRALQEAADDDDLWWQVRAFEELGWTTELDALVLENEDRIETDPDLAEGQRARLRVIAARAKRDKNAFRQAREAEERLDAGTDWNS